MSTANAQPDGAPRWPSLLGLALLFGFLGAALWWVSQRGPLPAAGFPTPTPVATLPSSPEPTTAAPTPTLSPSPTPTPDPWARARAALEPIARQVADVRQWPIREAIAVRFLSRQAWVDFVRERLAAHYPPEQAAQDAQIGALWGWWPPDFALWEAYATLYAQQSLGLYDCDKGQIVLVLEGEVTPLVRLTYAHQVAHALQAQNTGGCPPAWPAPLADWDAHAAQAALTEGDALLTTVMWASQNATAEEWEQLDAYFRLQGKATPSLPRAFREHVLFPYEEGMNFVQVLYSRGGWAGVNAAYTTPPRSTARILHPNADLDAPPVAVSLPEVTAQLGDGWALVSHGAFGEAEARMLLGAGMNPAARLAPETVLEATAGWAGGAYAVYRGPEGAWAALLKLVWRDGNARYAFDRAFRRYATARFGAPIQETTDAAFWQDEAGVHGTLARLRFTAWVLAPDEATTRQLLQALAAP